MRPAPLAREALATLALLLAAGCGHIGLVENSSPYADTAWDTAAFDGSTGEDANGSGTGSGNGSGSGSGSGAGADGSGSAESADPVTVDLSGRAWAVDLADVTFAEPPGLASMLSFMDSTVLLFGASGESTDSLDLLVALGAADGTQDPCERVQSLPAAAWTNPVFAIDEGQFTLTISHQEVVFRNTVLTATVSPDGSRWKQGELASRVDARELSAALDGADICSLVEGMGGACTACSDGVEQCFDVDMTDIEGESLASFDPSPSGC